MTTLEAAPPRAVVDRSGEPDAVLLARAHDGDETALGTLIERYRSFVRIKARSYFLVGGDREDVVQEGMIGLYKAIRDYDPAHETGFRSFAELCVTRQIITAIKGATRHKHAPLNTYVSLYLPSPRHDDEPERELLDQLESDGVDPAESVVSAQELARLERYFDDILSDLEAEVLRRYVEGQTYQEIAVALDRHVKAIDNALQRIKRKVGCYLQDRFLDEAV